MMDFMIKAVVFVLTCITFPDVMAAEDILTSSAFDPGHICITEGGFRYKYLGCYRDRGSQALPQRLYNAKKYINWNIEGYNFKKVIDVCAVHAHNTKGTSLFGVQFYGECWGDSKGARYDMYKKSKNCIKGVGGSWANAVYELIFDCEVNGVTYKDGADPIYIPQNPIQYNNISCQSCSCNQGVVSCQRNMRCDMFSKAKCEKLIPAPQGKCCPTCACFHKNTLYKSGQTWVNRQKNDCFECTCVANERKCELVVCPTNCPNPVYEPGKCCPSCNPGAPVTEPSFTVSETTTRPPPVFPPFPGFPGNQKRGLKMNKRIKRSNN